MNYIQQLKCVWHIFVPRSHMPESELKIHRDRLQAEANVRCTDLQSAMENKWCPHNRTDCVTKQCVHFTITDEMRILDVGDNDLVVVCRKTPRCKLWN